jgi:hypothetical protein
MLRREGVDRSLLGEAGVRHDDVDDTLFGFYRRSDTVEVIEVRGVSVDSGDVASDQFDCVVEGGLSTSEDKHVSAFGDKSLGDR